MRWSWFEIWVDDGLTPPYVLLVMSTDTPGATVQILDPQDIHRVVFESDDYETAKLWLLEDEYERMGDRVIQ